MLIYKLVICLSIINHILTQNDYPMMPNPGYDSITSHPIFDIGSNSQYSPIQQQISKSNIMTNGSIIVNTTNMAPQCNLECFMGCRVLFPEYIEQKYCIINMCKCKIIEKDVNLPVNNYKNASDSAQMVSSELHKYSTTAFVEKNNKNEPNLVKSGGIDFYWLFYIIIFSVSIGYECFIWNYISKENDFSLINWFYEQNDTSFRKYKETRDNYIEEINENNQYELRKCLL